ncbi:ABC transporter ATP-binding protein [Atopobium sp. oral taxon 810]|uniref:amino acid ABC transporter ATP-binding/permease protein n=1 Tax=Atopobium sp. oral taxon 810 TaxID=712158 RepID=UPI0003973411|nr:ABC transporter ATP-binding protein [Atopobium sp. oral taxon 810]ERI05870.1 thiol reductant ABC exporter, CydC subunit [Atopobium sp. oral taxon 810 str. F0209]
MKKRSKVGVLLQMLGLVRPLTGHMCLAVVAGTFAFLAVQFIPVLGGYALLAALGYKTPFPLGTIFVLLPLLVLFRAVLRYIEQKTNHYIAFTLLAIIRDKVFQALRRLCPAKLEGRDKGDLVSLITSDVELLEVFYAHTISPICIAILTETVMCLFIGSFNPLLGLLALVAFLAVGVLVPAVVSKISGAIGDDIRYQSGELSSFVFESIRGLDETIQFGEGKRRRAQMDAMSDELAAAQGTLSKLTGCNTAISYTVILIFDVLMLISSLYLYDTGALDFSGVVISVLALLSSYGPVAALAGLGTTLQSTVAAGSRVLDILDEVPETVDVAGEESTSFTEARCDKLSFSYGGTQVLKDISMSFEPGKIVGIIGKSGSGKSTLLKLLMRFYEADGGAVSVSGRNINKINTKDLRAMESYMTQDTDLFHDSIMNNVRIARLDATDEEVREACRKAALDEFIMMLPEGYDTLVGELGSTLSGGERQRIGLARVFLHDAPFVLLDEPTSNLDSLNEAVVLKALKESSDGKAIALVSHRASTLRIADDIYSVENGRLS